MQKEYYKEYAILEKNHWWFRARLEILKMFVSGIKQRMQKDELKILNVGVATGRTSLMLEEFGKVTSVEYDKDCCDYLREVAKIEVTEASATDLPFDKASFDIVCAFDVIEHIEDDQTAIHELKRVLKEEGEILITVPAYMFLWSNHDVINQHFRRYTKKGLERLLNDKFEVNYTSYFNFILFPFIAVARLIGNLFKKNEAKSDFEEFQTNSLLSRIFFSIFNSEKLVLGRFQLPFGVSIIYNGIKKDSK